MRRCFLFSIGVILFSFVVQSDAQNPIEANHPEVPRVSAYEAYVKFKAAKAIIIHAGGEAYAIRHIMGAFNVPEAEVTSGKIKLPKFPMTGIEIFIYCY